MANAFDYESVLKDMLATVPDSLDKREGSVIYTALAPIAYHLAAQNYMLANLFDLMFADTSEGEWLERVVANFGMTREAATQAVREIKTYGSDGQAIDVPLGSRFSMGDVIFRLTEKTGTGAFKAVCEQEGTKGNLSGGTILPVDHINGLGSAELTVQPLVAARDAETDGALRERFYQFVRQSPFGGNIADYEQRTLSIDGVGAVKVFGAPSLEAGQVGLVIGDEQGNKASGEMVATVQSLYGVNGEGLAPIGHKVTVRTCDDLAVNVEASIRLRQGTSFDIVKPVVEKTIGDYIENVAFDDETVFHSKLVAAILGCDSSILDVGAVTLNKAAQNLTLQKTYALYEVPVAGTITVTGVA